MAKVNLIPEVDKTVTLSQLKMGQVGEIVKGDIDYLNKIVLKCDNGVYGTVVTLC